MIERLARLCLAEANMFVFRVRCSEKLFVNSVAVVNSCYLVSYNPLSRNNAEFISETH